MIHCSDIHKSLGGVQILRGVNLDVARGEVISLVGPSGAGKTTLLQILGTLSPADRGELRIAGVDPRRMKPADLLRLRNRQIGFVFQFHHLLPELTALENVSLPAWIEGNRRRGEVERQARELLDVMGVAHRLGHKPAQLSGGEQQRVAVARALINNPSVILADEPSGNLDTHNREELHRLFFTLRDRFGHTFLIVTHDNDLAAMSDRRVVMRDGLIEP